MKHLSGFQVEQMSDTDRYILSEIIKQKQQENARRSTPEKYFEIFSAEQILKKREFDLDQDEIRSGIVGGADDGGVDSIYLFANRRLIREDTDLALFSGQQLNIELIIIQSKHKNAFQEGAVDKLDDFTENCLRLNSDLTKVSRVLYSQTLIYYIARFHTLYKEHLTQRPTLSGSIRLTYHFP